MPKSFHGSRDPRRAQRLQKLRARESALESSVQLTAPFQGAALDVQSDSDRRAYMRARRTRTFLRMAFR